MFCPIFFPVILPSADEWHEIVGGMTRTTVHDSRIEAYMPAAKCVAASAAADHERRAA